MARSLGDLVTIVGADFSSFNEAMGSLTDQVKNAQRDFQSAGQALSLSLTLPIAGFATAAVTAYANTEKLMLGLTAVAGSAAAAEVQMAQLREVAKLPGLALDQAVQGSIRLQAIGVTANESQRYIKAFGNALATVGKGAPELDLVITQLTQSLAKGKVQASDWRSIIEQVPQAATAIKRAFNTIDTEQLQKAGISSQQLINVVVSSLEKLPPVSGGIGNAFENLKDSVAQSLSNVGSIIAPLVSKAVDVIGGLLSHVNDLAAGFKALPPVVQLGAISLTGLAALAGPALLGVAGALKLIEAVSDASVALFGIARTIVQVSASFITLAVDAIAVAAAALYSFAIEAIPAGIAAVAEFGFTTIPAAITSLISFAATGVPAAIAALVEFAVVSVPAAVMGLGAFIAEIPAAIAGLIALAAEGLGAVIAAMATAYAAALPALLVGLKALVVVAAIAAAAFAAWKLLQWVAQLQIVQDAIGWVKQKFSELIDWLMKLPAVQAIVEAFGKAWSWVKGVASEAGEAVKSVAKSALSTGAAIASSLAPAADTTQKLNIQTAEQAKAAKAAAKAMKEQQKAANDLVIEQGKLNQLEAAYLAQPFAVFLKNNLLNLALTTDAFKTLGVTMTYTYEQAADKAAAAYAKLQEFAQNGAANERELAEARLAMIQTRVNAEVAAGQLISNSERQELEAAKSAAASYHQDLRTDAEQTAAQISDAWKRSGLKNIDAARDELDKRMEAYGELLESGTLTAEQIQKANAAMAKAAADVEKQTTGKITLEMHNRVVAAELAAGQIDDIYKELGVSNVAVMEETLAKQKATYEAAVAAGQLSAQQRLQAELTIQQQQADIERATTGVITEETQKRIDQLKQATGQQTTQWQSFKNQVSTIITDLGKDISNTLFDGEGSFGQRMLGVLEDVGKAFVRTFVEMGVNQGIKVMTDALKGDGLKSLTSFKDTLSDIGKSISGIFGAASSGASAAGGVAKAAGGAGSAAGSILGGAMGMVNMVSGIAGAVGSIATGIISIFNQRGENKILENIQTAVENSFKDFHFAFMPLWESAHGLLVDTIGTLHTLTDFTEKWLFSAVDRINANLATTNGLLGLMYQNMQARAGGTVVIQVSGVSSTGDVVNEIMRQLQLQGYVVR